MSPSDQSESRHAGTVHTFTLVRRLLLERVPPMVVVKDEGNSFEIHTPTRGDRPGEMFARLSQGQGGVTLQVIRVGQDMSSANAMAPRLVACQRGAHDFTFETIDEELRREIDRMVQFRYSICQARRLI